ncbi:MAG: hypothetical protein KF704_02830 [Crocinitomicaceae bacterium]|nr:hypothetical protein [Crocinitomicaceae bacterium]
MKRKLLFANVLIIYSTGISQTTPAGGGQGTNSIEYWSRSGNNQNGSNNNIFGTKWNFLIKVIQKNRETLYLKLLRSVCSKEYQH